MIQKIKKCITMEGTRMEEAWTYCPKCGAVAAEFNCHCGCQKRYKIDPKWGINLQRKKELLTLCEYGEITNREFAQRWIAVLTPFIDEVVRKQPEFDESCYAKVIQTIIETGEQQDQIVENMNRQAAAEAAIPKITCPYCKSTNTKKLYSLSRAFSAGFFGLGSSKIGKQWHCNSCGSDF